MTIGTTILNEREAREARTTAAEYEKARCSENVLAAIVEGLPAEVVDGYRKALEVEKYELERLIEAYESAKSGDATELKQRAGNDPGHALIVARIVSGLTQKELGRKLGVKEQQIQRYEADRYRTISLSNFQKVASTLGVNLEMKFTKWHRDGWNLAQAVSAKDITKIIKHARAHNWFEKESDESLAADGVSYLQRYVTDHIIRYGTPSLLRTGLNVEDHTDDMALLAWKAHVTRRAEKIISEKKIKYKPLEVSWLVDLVKLSREIDGPIKAREMLLTKGIVLMVEPQIPGMKVDGAAFLLDGVPVIGMTLRRDTIDNFWFTLLHEIAHIILHYRTGLASGFFDDTDNVDVDEIEAEANSFAGNLLIPDEVWNRSPARIAKGAPVIEKFAQNQGIHPAIVFGRIQRERKNYAIFSNKLGRGQVRKQLIT